MQIFRWLSGVIVLSLLSFIPSFPVLADDARPSDVRIIVDISGSMKETDPQNLRVPAVNLLVELLPDNAQAGVWTFGQYVNMLVPLNLVDRNWRTQAKDAAKTINSVGLYTNLSGALDKASWKIAADSGFEQTVILLTDGRIDMPPGAGQADASEAERQRLFAEVLPQYAQAGARIHTLALSDAADTKLLKQIALETGGMFLQADNADDLLKVFLKAFDRAVPVEQVPMDNNRFEIDDSVSEFTALIFRQAGGRETRLIDPAGHEIFAASATQNNNVRWHQDVNFDLITVKNPAPGSWQADADLDPDNRVQVLSDLSLSVDGLPNTIFAGNPVDLEMALRNQGDVVAEPAILKLTDFTLKVTAPDGRSGSKLLSDPEHLPLDGVFRESMTRLSQEGEYRFEITAVGRTFQRRQVLTASLMQPMTVQVEDNVEQQRVRIMVTPEGAAVDSELSRVIAKVSSPDGSSLIHTMEFSADDNAWSMDLTADKGPGRYDVMLNIRGVSAGGATFKSKPDDIIRDFPLTDPAAVMPQEPAVEETTPAETPAQTPAEPEIRVPPMTEPEVPAAPPAEPEAEATPEEENIVPDLAKRLEEQAALEEALPAEEEGVAWWIWLLLALGNLLIFGGAGYWLFMKRRRPADTAEDDTARGPVPDLSEEPSDMIDEDFAGDFDSFAEEGEEDIPLPDDQPSAPSSMGSDTNIDVSLDDDFAIDPDDSGAADEDWGEFDADPDDNKP